MPETPNPYELVRARDKAGARDTTTTRFAAENYGYEVLDGHDTVDAFGNPLPDKPHKPIAPAKTAAKA